MGTFFSDFKKFISKGNVIDLSVGVVIGGAFGKITSSLVADIIMPLVGLAVGGLDVSQWKIVLKEAILNADGTEAAAEVAIKFGSTIAVIVDFIIVAFAIFCMIKFLNNLRKKEEEVVEEPAPEPEVEPAPPAPTSEELLAEIRDLLKNK